MARLSDTTAEAGRVLRQAYCRQTAGEKWLRLSAMFAEARALHAAGFRQRQPAATPADIQRDWLGRLGCHAPIGEFAMSQPLPAVQETRAVIRVLDQLGIPYVLGGSLASSLHGIDRYTRDADLGVEPFPGKEAQLAASFASEFYLSLPAIEAAIRDRSSFNIINTRTGFKIDLFVRADTPFEQSVLARRIALRLPDDPGQPIMVQSPEDVVLHKLRWYRLGGESGDQQWQDVLGVFRVQGDRLDQAYLDRWAADLRIEDLLAKARQEAG